MSTRTRSKAKEKVESDEEREKSKDVTVKSKKASKVTRSKAKDSSEQDEVRPETPEVQEEVKNNESTEGSLKEAAKVTRSKAKDSSEQDEVRPETPKVQEEVKNNESTEGSLKEAAKVTRSKAEDSSELDEVQFQAPEVKSNESAEDSLKEVKDTENDEMEISDKENRDAEADEGSESFNQAAPEEDASENAENIHENETSSSTPVQSGTNPDGILEKTEIDGGNEEEEIDDCENDVETEKETNSDQKKCVEEEDCDDEVKAIMEGSNGDEVEEVIDDDEEEAIKNQKKSAEVISLSSSSSPKGSDDKKEEPDLVELSSDDSDDIKEQQEAEMESDANSEGDPSREPGADAKRFIDPDHLLPFKHGWKREVVMRKEHQSGSNQCDVYYWPPANGKHRTREAKRKRRSKADQEKFFEDFPSDILSVINFNYVRRPLELNNRAYEIIRRSRGLSRDAKRSGVSYKEVPESRGLMQDDSDEEINSEDDIEYVEGLDIDMPSCPQIQLNITGLRNEYKRRKKVRNPETCVTPPLAENLLWTELDDDPLGVYNELGGRSSPSTPPPLRAVKLTRNETATKILKAFEEVKEEAKKVSVTKEPECTENLASHDMAIRKYKNYVDKSSNWFPPGISSRIRNLPQGMPYSRGQIINKPNLSPNSIMSGGANSLVKVRLPMRSINGKRPVVELVLEQNGKYQPIKFSNNMQVTESIYRAAFDQANRSRKTVYQKARQVPKIGNRQLYLAINPSSSTFLNGLMPQRASQMPNRNQPNNSSSNASSPDQVAILVKPQKGPNSKPVLLNVPRKIALKVKRGTTLSFSASNDQKYVVLDSKIHPPVGSKRQNGNSSTNTGNTYRSNNNVNYPLAARSRGMPGRNFNGNSRASNPLLSNQMAPLNLPPSVSIRPVNAASTVSQAWRNRSPQVYRGPMVSRNIIRPNLMKRRLPLPSGLTHTTPAKAPRKVLSTGEVIGHQAVVTPCTPYCPGVQGFPELECTGCQSLFHSKCVDIPAIAVSKVKKSFKCKMCASPKSRNSPQVINLD